jgi:pimeloyl-ACP methyl ester carboxylesterase
MHEHQRQGFMVRSRLVLACAAFIISTLLSGAANAAEPPLALARDGFFYVNGKPTTVSDRAYISGQMYVEVRIPAEKTKPYPIIMVHGGTMSGTNFTGTPDGREGWAQYFVRQGYAVYVVDQPGRGRFGYLAVAYGPNRNVERSNSAARFVAQEKFKLWPRAHLHTQWPGTGEPDDDAIMQIASGQLPAIESFTRQQFLNRDALVALLEKIGPSILLVHSQAGAFGWPVADIRPDLVKAILAIEPNGPPFYGIEFIGAPDWFRPGALGTRLRHHVGAARLRAAGPEAGRSGYGSAGKAGRTGSRALLCAKGAGPATTEPAEGADPGADVRSVLPRALRSLHGEVSAAGGREADLHPARRPRHPRQ